MKMKIERRRAARKLAVAAIGLAVCTNGCAYFSAQPEVNPDKFAPQESDRAWIPKTNEYVIPTQARPASTLPEPHATVPGNKYDLPALIDIALSNNPDTQQTWERARAAAAAYGASRAPYYPVVSAQVPGGYERELFELPGTKRRAQAMAGDAGTRVHLHADRLRPPRRRRRRRARATGGGELFVQPQAAGRGVRDAARVLFDRRGQGGGEGGGAERRAGEDRRRGRQPPRRSGAGDSARAAAVAPARRTIAIRSRQRASAGARGAGEHGGRAGSGGQRGF